MAYGCRQLKAKVGLKHSLPSSITQLCTGHSFLLPDGLLRAAHNMAASFSTRKKKERESSRPRWKLQPFCNLISEVIYHHFCHMPLVTQTNCETECAGFTVGCEYQEAKIIGSWPGTLAYA